jgi:integrase
MTGVKEGTIRIRRHELSNLYKKFGYMKLKDITLHQYQLILSELADTFSLNTLLGIHRTCRMVFKYAMKTEAIKKDPTEYAIVPKQPKEYKLARYLEKEDLKRFLHVVSEFGLPQDDVIFYLLAYTGMRVGELCSLTWSDLTSRDLSISKTYYNPTNNKQAYVLTSPKTESARRTIDVDERVVKMLERHRTRQLEDKMKHRQTYHDGNFMFADEQGYPLYPKFVHNRMTRLLKLANLPDTLSPHSLRHTHTSLLAEAGVSLETIMERLGHKDDDTTRNVYLHVTKATKKEASIKFANLMDNL